LKCLCSEFEMSVFKSLKCLCSRVWNVYVQSLKCLCSRVWNVCVQEFEMSMFRVWNVYGQSLKCLCSRVWNVYVQSLKFLWSEFEMCMFNCKRRRLSNTKRVKICWSTLIHVSRWRYNQWIKYMYKNSIHNSHPHFKVANLLDFERAWRKWF
jgi:hypothetical protein